jgi:2-polyprenyl-3-methyl-5-hydroxy-6-metoxy-1,4-benzoquinol methylase
MAECLTVRQQREREFYEEYSRLNAIDEVSFDPVLSKRRKPWNSYWFVYDLARSYCTSSNLKLLDFGCGSGVSCIRFAKLGYNVTGFDISPSNIFTADRLARKYGLDDRIKLSVAIAEQIDYPTEYFDIVVGIDILHHVEIGPALQQCLRVLKKGGTAIFHEPVEVPIFDRVRNSSFGRWLVPKTVSLERHLTADERKLTFEDIKTIKSLCPDFSAWRFLLFSRGTRYSALEKLDHYLFKVAPYLQNYGGIIVMMLRKT